MTGIFEHYIHKGNSPYLSVHTNHIITSNSFTQIFSQLAFLCIPFPWPASLSLSLRLYILPFENLLSKSLLIKVKPSQKTWLNVSSLGSLVSLPPSNPYKFVVPETLLLSPKFHRRRFIRCLQSTKEQWTPCTHPWYWRHRQHQNSTLFINAGFRRSAYPSAAAPDHQYQSTRGRRKLKGPPQWREGMSPKFVARITSRTSNRRFRKPKGRRTKGMSVRAFLWETVAGVAM